MAAFHAGYQAIDDGRTFMDGFGRHLTLLGYRDSPEAECGCADKGRHGHQPECRWVKA